MSQNDLFDYENDDNVQIVERRGETRTERRSGCLGASAILGTCLVLMAGCLGIPVIALVFTLVTGANTLQGVVDGIVNIINPPARATVTSTPTIVNSIQPLGQLVSISAQIAKADIRVAVQDGFQNACGRTAHHVAQGAIEAGIDLTQVGEDDISYDAFSQTYSVTLPPPQITSCRIDYLRQYDRSTSACGTDWDNLRVMAQYEAMLEFRQDAVEGGILERAQEEAQITLDNFLGSLTGRRIEITFAQPDPEAPLVFPQSCEPEPPGVWSYDADGDYWTN